MKRQIIGVLDRIFPEYETLFSSIFIQSSRRLLAEAVSPVEFADCDLSELADLLQRSSRGRFGSVKAAEILPHALSALLFWSMPSVQMRCLLGQL